MCLRVRARACVCVCACVCERVQSSAVQRQLRPSRCAVRQERECAALNMTSSSSMSARRHPCNVSAFLPVPVPVAEGMFLVGHPGLDSERTRLCGAARCGAVRWTWVDIVDSRRAVLRRAILTRLADATMPVAATNQRMQIDM